MTRPPVVDRIPGEGDGYRTPVRLRQLFLPIVAAIVIVARSIGRTAHAAPGPAAGRDPIDILKERFARGEIDKDEYEERRRVLGD